jgi:hypothetical protein
VGKSGLNSKPFEISKQLVWEAYRRVAANKGAAGVDGQSVEDFEADLKNNLYKIWNRMSSGSYFPPAVKAVEIPKPHGGGVRVLGVPTVADRVAQTVVALALEARTEAIFHDDSYGYRPRRSALDAVATCRRRCWRKDWVLDLDVSKFFDSVDHDLMLKAVAANTDQKWALLYVKRWLTAPLQLPDGALKERDRGTPQGGLCSAEHNPPWGEPCSVGVNWPFSITPAFSQRRIMSLAGNEPSASRSRPWSILSNAAVKSASKIHTRRACRPRSVVNKEPTASAQPRPGRNPYDRGSNRASHSGSNALRTRA